MMWPLAPSSTAQTASWCNSAESERGTGPPVQQWIRLAPKLGMSEYVQCFAEIVLIFWSFPTLRIST
jgi:hypothetical protein